MSNLALTSEAQLHYILKWFGEFSELQREDFLPVLAAAHAGNLEQLVATLASLSCEDKPVSLFQCRIKLFNEWFPTWAEEERDRLVSGVSQIDSDFGSKLQDAIVNGVVLNGDADESYKLQKPEDDVRAEDGVAEPLDENRVPTNDNISIENAVAS